MRIIGGIARGRKLHAPEGPDVRPTADRVKEALFSILISRFGNLRGLKILDLFAGTGNLGIEALSRGAEQAVFVDSDPRSIRLVLENLNLTGFTSNAEVVSADALSTLKMLHKRRLFFDIVFLDPPYRESGLLQTCLKLIASQTILSPGGVLILETGKTAALPVTDHIVQLDRRIYGDTAITLFGIGSQP